MELSSSAFVTVPHGWQRLIEKKEVIYVSPNQSCMRNRDEVVRYLSSPSTCKCGLKCPFSFDEHFNFDSNVIGLPDSRPFTGYSDCHLLPNLYVDNKNNRGKAKARKATAIPSGKTKPTPPPIPKAGPTKSAKAHQPVRPTKGHPVIKPMTIPLSALTGVKGLNLSAKGAKTDQQLILTAPNYPLVDFQALIEQLSAAAKSSSTMIGTMTSPSVSIGTIQLKTTTTKLPATCTTSKATRPGPKPSTTTTTTVLSAVPSPAAVVNKPDVPPQNLVISDKGQKGDSNDTLSLIVNPVSTESDLLNLLHNMDDNQSPVVDQSSPGAPIPQTTPTKLGQNVVNQSTAPPTQSVTVPTKLMSPPTQSVTTSTQSVTPPTQSAAPPTQSAAPPTQYATPPTQSAAPPTQSVTPPTQSATPPTQSAAPPTQSVTPPTQFVTPPTQSVTPPTPPTQFVTSPTQSIPTPNQTLTSPTKLVSPPTQSITTPTQSIATPTKSVTQNIPAKNLPPCLSETTPTPEPSRSTSQSLITNDNSPVPVETNTEGDNTTQSLVYSPHAQSTPPSAMPLSTSLGTQENSRNNNASNNNGIWPHTSNDGLPPYKVYNFRKRPQSSNGHRENQPVLKKRKKQLLMEEGDGKGSLMEEGDGKGSLMEEGDGKESLMEEGDGKESLKEEGDGKGSLMEEGDGKGSLMEEGDGKESLMEERDGKGSLMEEGDGEGSLMEEGDGEGSLMEERDGENTRGYNLRNRRSASYTDKLLSGDDKAAPLTSGEEFVMEDDSFCISESPKPRAPPTQALPTPPDTNDNSSVTSDREMHDLSLGTLENGDKDDSTDCVSATGGMEGSSLLDPSPLSSTHFQGITEDDDKLPRPSDSTRPLFVPASLVQLATAANRELNEEVWPPKDSRETSQRLSTGSQSTCESEPVEQPQSSGGYSDDDTGTLSLLVCVPFKCLPNRVYMQCYSASSFHIGDVVWAKAAGLAGWPGKIIKHTDWTMNKLQRPPAKHMWIRWYNNDCVSLVQENHLKPLLFGCGQTLKYKSKNRKKLEIAIKEAACEYRERQKQCLQF